MDLHWQQKWWKHILGAIVMLYVGGKGYFTDLTALFKLTDEFTPRKKAAEKHHIEPYQNQLMEVMKEQRPWLRPDLTLSELANQLKMSANQLSQVVNQGYGKNFNDFINEFRVQEVQRKLTGGASAELSLLGIALDSGFNSKATFNRTFKKITGQTPTEFLKQQQ